MKVSERTVVTMDYELRYPDGELIESSIESGQSLQFIYGRGEILSALEKAILDKEPGDKITVTLSPEEAYGPWEEEGQCIIPRQQFPQDMELEEGMMFTMDSEDGRQVPFTIVNVSGNDVVVDFNHPLAGETLVFDLYIRDVRLATLEELANRPSCSSDSCDKGCC